MEKEKKNEKLSFGEKVIKISDNLYEGNKLIIIFIIILLVSATIQIVLFQMGILRVAGVSIDDPNSYIGWISISLTMIGSPLVFTGAIYQVRLNTKFFIFIFIGNIFMLINAILIGVLFGAISYILVLIIVVMRIKNWKKRDYSPTSLTDPNPLQRKKNQANFLRGLSYALLAFMFALLISEILFNLGYIEVYQDRPYIRWLDIIVFSFIIFGTILINYKLQESFLIFTIMKIFSIALLISFGQLILMTEALLWFTIDITSFMSWRYKQKHNIK